MRKALQLSVVAFIAYAALGTLWRNYKLAHNSSRLVGLMHGETWGRAYRLNEDFLLLMGEDTAHQSTQFLGFPWAGRIAGLDTADPILAVSLALRDGAPPLQILLALLLPLGLALVLGKVFCSHLCPMRLAFELGELVRTGLKRLRVPLPEVVSDTRLGGWVLVGGSLATLFAGTAVWLLILPYTSLAIGMFSAITTGALSVAWVVVLLWWVIDVLFAPGYWCHNLCPTGFLLEMVGRFSLLRLVKRGIEECPKSCNLCERACPYRLRPKHREHRPACDNCGRCASVCPSQRLVRKLPVLAFALAWLAFPGGASAHHNKGLPHYGYYENYPQVPTEEHVEIQGRWEIGATIFNFQGYDLRQTSDTPNDVKIFLYLYDLENDENYTGPVDIEIRRDGEVVARYDRTEVDSESIYSTRETLPETGEYELVCLFEGNEASLRFYVDLNDGLSWSTIAMIVFPVLLVFGLAVKGRSRRTRRRRRRRPRKLRAGLTSLLLLSFPTLASAQTATECVPGDGLGQTITPDGPLLVMQGMPLGWLLASIAAILAVSFAASEFLVRRKPTQRASWRLNLLRRRRAYELVQSRWFQAVPQTLMIGVLLFLIYVGLSGSRVANLAPVAVWTLWWSGLVFAVLFTGASWCFVCPWDGLANLFSRLRLAAKVEPISLGFRFPKRLSNLYPAILLFTVLSWFELGWSVTSNPRATAYLGLAMAAAAIVGALLFDGKRFCAHACPVGRICGIYGNFAPVEVRARNPKVCARCTTEDCLHGHGQGYACPTGISLKVVQEATDCTMCMECVKSCEKRNVAINLRPFGSDLRPARTPRPDEAWLALVLLALTLFHGLSMTSLWESFGPGRWSFLKWATTQLGVPRLVAFSFGMAVAAALPIALYGLACKLSAWWAGDGVPPSELFVRYASSLLPVALFYHLAHNLMHLLMEGGHVVPLLSDPMGRGDDLLGTASMRVDALISDDTLWLAQLALILVGHVAGIVVAHRIGHRLHATRKRALRSLVPIFAAMVIVSVSGVGLMHLDMNMRLGRM